MNQDAKSNTPDKPAEQRPSRKVYVLLVLAAFAYCVPLFKNLDYYGRIDWDQFTFRYETPRIALLRDHQLPLWNPYTNGGTVLLAHPDCPAASPWYLPVLVLGAPLGLRVQVVLFMALGAIGMAALLRRWNVPDPGRFVAGVVFMMSSHFALHITEGHLEWCVLGLMPWALLCLLQLGQGPRWIVIAALLMASVLTFGSVYIMAVYVPFLSLWCALESLRTRSWQPVVPWAGVLLLTVLLSAVKLIPQLEFVSDHPRPTQSEGISFRQLAYALFYPQQSLLYRALRDVGLNSPRLARFKSVPDDISNPIYNDYITKFDERTGRGFKYNWHEYGCYVTYFGLALAACGFAVSWRTIWPLYLAGLAAAITAMGNGSPIDLWSLLQKLPLYHSLHVPSRFLAAVVLVLAVAAGFGCGWLCDREMLHKSRILRLFLLFGIPAAVFFELATMGWSLFGDIFVCPPLPVTRYDHFATRHHHARPVEYEFVMQSLLYPRLVSNSGVLHGYENIAVKQAGVTVAGEPNYRGEAFLEFARGTAAIRDWTMSRVNVAVTALESDRLCLNQNDYKGWYADIRGESGVKQTAASPSASGLISVAVEPDVTEVEFYYRPRSFLWGAAVSALTLTGCLVFLVRRRCG